MAADSNTPEGRIEQASGLASHVTSGARVSRGRRSVLVFLGGVVLATLVVLPLVALALTWWSDWVNN